MLDRQNGRIADIAFCGVGKLRQKRIDIERGYKKEKGKEQHYKENSLIERGGAHDAPHKNEICDNDGGNNA